MLGSDNIAPYSFTWTNVTAGNYIITATAIDNTEAYTISQGVNIIVNSEPFTYSRSKRIQNGSDDVEETASGSVVLNSDDIDLVFDTNTKGNQIVGLRFNGVSYYLNSMLSN